MNPLIFVIALLTILDVSIIRTFVFNDSENIGYNIYELPRIYEGDLVFRRGKSIESYAVLKADGSVRYSHVGIAHINKNGDCTVVHAVPADNKTENKVRIEPLSDFWDYDNASAGAVYRLKLNNYQREIIGNYVKRIFNEEVEFDGAYDLHDTSKLYCTELVRNAYQKCNIDILSGNMDTLYFPKQIPIIFPGTILKNKKIQQIYSYTNN